jgi:putative DNA primase/helicase
MDEAERIAREAAAKAARSQREAGDTGRADAGFPPAGEGVGRMVLQLEPGEPHEAVRTLNQLLAKHAETAGVYVFAGRLTQPVQRERKDDKGRLVLVFCMVEVQPTTLVVELAKLARFEKLDRRSGALVPHDPPEKLMRAILDNPREWRVPEVHALARVPIMRADGSIATQPGYDHATGVLLLTDDLDLPPLPPAPTYEDACAALRLLRQLLEEFPFAPSRVDSDAAEILIAEAVALALVMTSVLRPSIVLAPGFVIRAGTPGTGKSTLVDVVWILMTGHEAPVISLSDKADEAEKRINAALLGGAAGLPIDNVTGILNNDRLCQILSQPRIATRLLGTLQQLEAETRVLVTVTGNNVDIAGDLVRRGLKVDLSSDAERPWENAYKRDIISWTKENRGRLVHAVLVIVLAWQAAGRSRAKVPPFNTYAQWSDLVRQPLIWLGVPDPYLSIDETAADDPVRQMLLDLFAAWTDHLGQRWVTLAQVIEAAQQPIVGLRHALLTLVGLELDPGRVGHQLRRHKMRVVGGMRLEQDATTRPARWRVVRMGETGAF